MGLWELVKMCNKKISKKEDTSVTLILYRLDKLEEEQRKNNSSIMTLLQEIQNSLTTTNKTIVLHTSQIKQLQERIETLEEQKIDKKEYQSKHDSVVSRLDIYKQILMAVAGGLGVSLLIELIKLI